MMRSLADNLLILILITPLLFAGGLAAQTGPGDEARQDAQDAPAPAVVEKTEPAPKKAEEPAAVRKAPAKEVKQAAAKKEEPEPVRNKVDTGGAGGVLDIQDGDFLYRRIPDKKFPEAVQSGLEGFETGGTSLQPAGAELPEMSQRKGLFGMSAESTNYVAKGMLLFIIIIIFVLYRLRSRTRRSTVHKSFR